MPNERILVVDDSRAIREVLAHTILASAGYDVLTASSGEEGLILAQDLHPDLIISDYLLPKMTGLDMFQAIRGADLNMPLILMTAEGSEALAVKALRAGVNDYLIKPVDSSAILEAVALAMRRYWTEQIKERIPSHLFESNRKLEQRVRELNSLVNIGTSVTAMLDIQQVLNSVVDAAVQVTNAEEGSLMMLDASTGELYMRASRNLDQRTVHTLRLQVNDSLAGNVVNSGQPLIMDGDKGVKIKTAYFVKSVVYIPLRAKGKVIGILTVDNRAESRKFDNHDVQILTVLADFASVAVENARLYAETSQERDTLGAILQDTEDYVIVIDALDRVVFCNPTAQRAFNVTTVDFIGKPLHSVISDPEVQSLFGKNAESGRSRRSEITLSSGGVEKILNAQLTIIEGLGRAIIMQDITPLKELDRAKSDFVAAVAHDLRSPLTAVLGYTELLQRAGSLNDQQTKFTEQIIGSVHSITGLITELLELSRIEAGFNLDLQPVAIDAIAHQVIKNFDHHLTSKGHVLITEIAADLPKIMGNSLRVQQMMSNLLGNAIKYTPDNGRVTLKLWNDADQVILQVSDTGIGIPAEDQPYIFDKFFRTTRAVQDFEGTGLGLSIVKGIVDQHGGRIWLDSKENIGTTFTVVLTKDKGDISARTASPETATA